MLFKVPALLRNTTYIDNESLLRKFHALDPASQDKLLAFWSFLLAKSKVPSEAIMSPAYRKQIAQISVWTDEAFAALQEGKQSWKWEPPT